MLRISQEALTFDDVLLIPGYSEVLPKDVSLKTRLTRGIELNIPLLSAAMDTVTEARLAIAMAQEGGIGIIHKNMTIEQQAAEVRKVKKFEAGVVKDPITIEADATIRDLFELTRQNNISGVPVLSSNNLPNTNITGHFLSNTFNSSAYDGDFTKTIASIFSPKAIMAGETIPVTSDVFFDKLMLSWCVQSYLSFAVGPNRAEYAAEIALA